jgi:hypothetical protein
MSTNDGKSLMSKFDITEKKGGDLGELQHYRKEYYYAM